MAFYGFLRVSKLTSLKWNDLPISADHISTMLHQSKTDPFRRGCTIRIYYTKLSTCPYHALDRYQKLIGEVTPSNHLYEAGRFHPLSRAVVTNILCQLLR